LKRRNIWVIVGVAAVVVIIIAGVALWNYHEQPQFCATCHIMQPYLESWESSPFLAYAHAEEEVTCLECHEPTIEQQVHELIVTVKGDYDNPLQEREFPKEECFECHEHESYEQLIELTKDYAVDGEQINPHVYTVDSEALAPDAYIVDSEAPDPHDSEQGECYQCHKVHRESPGIDYCYECHHDAIFLKCSECHKEWHGADLLGQAHAEVDVTCLDCHEPTIQQQLQEGIQVATQDYQAAFAAEREFPKESCLSCHEHGSYEEIAQRTEELELNPHDSHYGEMECSICHRAHEASEEVCAYCHDPIATGPGWTIPTQLTTEFLEWWDPDMDCAFCHVSYTESMQDATLLAYGHAQEELVCLDCHEQAVLEQVHEEAKPGTPRLKVLRFSSEFCLDCHVPNEHTSYEEVIERTKDYTVDDEEINPHNPHVGLEETGQYECYLCHRMHKESPLINGCYGCHHEETFENCSACHY
jgi:formate-dependent nitrite reductase cytochrome c552 subunit